MSLTFRWLEPADALATARTLPVGILQKAPVFAPFSVNLPEPSVGWVYQLAGC